MNKFHLFVIISAMLSGTIVFSGGVFSKWGLSSYQIAFISLIIPILALLPFVIFRQDCRLKKDLLPLIIFYGLVTSVICLSQYTTVVLGVPVGIAVLLLYTHPVWTLIFTRLFLKEKITRIKLVAALIVVVGIVILVNPTSVDFSKIGAGIIVALIGGIALSGWIILGCILSQKGSPIVATKFYNALFTFTFILLSYPIMSRLINNPKITSFSMNFPPHVWIWLILFSIFVELINHLLYFEGVKKVPVITAGIICLLEPVVGAILATLFLNQAITINLLFGGALILFANYLIIRHGN